MDREKLSIVIVNYNNRQELDVCLYSINKTKGLLDLEIFVYDNNSSDGSQDMVKAKYPFVNLIANDRNLGLSRVINSSLKKLTGEYILFLDSDTELKSNALQNLISFLQGVDDAGIAGPRVYNEDGSMQETTRRFPTFFSGLFGRRAVITRLFPGNPISRRFLCMENIHAKEPFEVDYISAACMMMKREVVSKLRAMDEKFFVYWTDVDWCRRAKNSGYKVFCVPSAKIIHYERYKPWKKKNPKMIMDFHRGAYIYYRKHNIRWKFSPLHFICASALAARASIHLLLNYFKR